tara:strand:+ start:291 stop:458 length:168 start_codon:yes stop_codon:yes gene_type:complete
METETIQEWKTLSHFKNFYKQLLDINQQYDKNKNKDIFVENVRELIESYHDKLKG